MGGTVSCFEAGNSGALLVAAMDGDVAVVSARLAMEPELLLHHGVGLGDTAWHLASAYGQVEVLKVMHARLVSERAVIAQALSTKKSAVTEDEAVIAAINQRNSKGQTPLMFACFGGKAEAAAFLLQKGADVWAVDRCGCRTAAHYATLRGSVPCLEAILSNVPERLRFQRIHNADVHLLDMKSISGLTPLHFAAYSRHAGVAKYLLAHGASLTPGTTVPDAYDLVSCPQWTTPLHLAAFSGNMETSLALLQYYLERRDTHTLRDPRSCQDRTGRTPFHVAQARRHAVLAEILHPLSNLDSLFEPEEVQAVGVPKLSLLAAAALREHLLQLVEQAGLAAPLFPRSAAPSAASSMRRAAAQPGGASPRSGVAHAPSWVDRLASSLRRGNAGSAAEGRGDGGGSTRGPPSPLTATSIASTSVAGGHLAGLDPQTSFDLLNLPGGVPLVPQPARRSPGRLWGSRRGGSVNGASTDSLAASISLPRPLPEPLPDNVMVAGPARLTTLISTAFSNQQNGRAESMGAGPGELQGRGSQAGGSRLGSEAGFTQQGSAAATPRVSGAGGLAGRSPARSPALLLPPASVPLSASAAGGAQRTTTQTSQRRQQQQEQQQQSRLPDPRLPGPSIPGQAMQLEAMQLRAVVSAQQLDSSCPGPGNVLGGDSPDACDTPSLHGGSDPGMWPHSMMPCTTLGLGPPPGPDHLPGPGQWITPRPFGACTQHPHPDGPPTTLTTTSSPPGTQLLAARPLPTDLSPDPAALANARVASWALPSLAPLRLPSTPPSLAPDPCSSPPAPVQYAPHTMPVDTTLTPRCGSAAAATDTTIETAADRPDDVPTISAPAPQPGIVSRALDGLKRRAFPGSSPPASAAQQPAEPGPGPVSSSNGQPSTADPFARLRDVFTSSSPNATRRPPATSHAPSAPLAAQVTNDATFQFEPPGTSPAPADVRSVALSQSRRPSSALLPEEAGQQLEALAQGSSSRGQQRNRQLLPSVPGRSATPEPQAGRLELLGQRSIPHQGSVQQAVVLTTQPVPQQQRQLGPPAMAHTSPFAKPSAWGTAAMIESLQPQATCTVCLDEGYALVTVSCLHRLCVDCARRVVATLKDHPLSCPVCRQLVRGFHAPNDLAGLAKALDS